MSTRDFSQLDPYLRAAKRSLTTFLVWALFITFVLGPLLTIVVISFVPNVFTGEQRFTFQWYARIFTEPQLFAPLVRTLEIAVLVVFIQLFFGPLVAFATVRNQVYGARLLDAMSNITIALPSVVVGIALFAFYGPYGPVRALAELIYGNPFSLLFTLWIVVFAHTLETFPYMVRSVAAGLIKFDPLLESAARSLGAGRWTVFRTITLPQLRPNLVAGGVLVFSRSVAEFGATIVVIGAALRTAPISIYAEVESGNLELASAYSVILMLISFFAYLAMTRWLLKREREAAAQL